MYDNNDDAVHHRHFGIRACRNPISGIQNLTAHFPAKRSNISAKHGHVSAPNSNATELIYTVFGLPNHITMAHHTGISWSSCQRINSHRCKQHSYTMPCKKTQTKRAQTSIVSNGNTSINPKGVLLAISRNTFPKISTAMHSTVTPAA
jgi:hypothetical protein